MAELTKEEVPNTIKEKKKLLLNHRIAIWDVIYSCEIQGSSDSSIREVVPNDIASLLKKSNVERIYGNGDKACRLYEKFSREQTGIDIIKLPSTSPANAAFSMERLMESWGSIL